MRLRGASTDMSVTFAVYRRLGKNSAGAPITNATFQELTLDKHGNVISTTPLGASTDPGFPFIYHVNLSQYPGDAEIDTPGYVANRFSTVHNEDQYTALMDPFPNP